MLRKIDCIMVLVPDLDTAARFYTDVLGLRLIWRDAAQIGLRFPETDAELVLHTDPDIPQQAPHYLVDDVIATVAALRAAGCRVLVEPFDIRMGQCAVVADPFGVTLHILDATKLSGGAPVEEPRP